MFGLWNVWKSWKYRSWCQLAISRYNPVRMFGLVHLLFTSLSGRLFTSHRVIVLSGWSFLKLRLQNLSPRTNIRILSVISYLKRKNTQQTKSKMDLTALNSYKYHDNIVIICLAMIIVWFKSDTVTAILTISPQMSCFVNSNKDFCLSYRNNHPVIKIVGNQFNCSVDYSVFCPHDQHGYWFNQLPEQGVVRHDRHLGPFLSRSSLNSKMHKHKQPDK